MDFNRENTSIIIGRIIARSINSTITPAEQAALDEWLQDDTNRRIYMSIRNGSSIRDALSEFEGFDVNEGYQRFRVSIGKNKGIRYRAWMAAAAILVLLTVSVTIYTVTRQENRQIDLTSTGNHDIAPGGNRAMLTLPNGHTITLDEARDGIVIGSREITYNDGDPLVEVADKGEGADEMTVLELTTPKGGTYQITLPDGTKVWLNAGSTMKYPIRFSGTERIVELTGEAYFSVVKDAKKPFKVVSAGQEIQVLGTAFNVSAYPDDPETKTTLVEGKVRLSLAGELSEAVSGNSGYVELIPGEQGIIRGERLAKANVDTGLYTAWKSGYFYFKRTPLEEILRQASRWYDVEVLYQGGVPSETFSGDIRRDVSLRGLLDILQHSTINVTLEGRTLIVRE